MGGDFNIPLNPLTDTSNGSTSIRYRTLKSIKNLLHSLKLIDSWRFLNPTGRDYTFYARLDYLFITQNDLHTLTEAYIGTQSISDHAPIALTKDLTKQTQKSQIWRLNSSILSDPTYVQDLKDSLRDFFDRNTTPGMDPITLWEAHKCTIRGELISIGSKRKKQRAKETSRLINRIHYLETLHKQSLSTSTASELLDTRKSLQNLFDTKAKRFLFFKKKIYYEGGNKPGKTLARALRTHTHSTNISGIKRANGSLDVSTEDIAKHFHEYYTNLYNLPPQHTLPGLTGDRPQIIREYLVKSGLPSLEDVEANTLECPIDTSEIKLAIKNLK